PDSFAFDRSVTLSRMIMVVVRIIFLCCWKSSSAGVRWRRNKNRSCPFFVLSLVLRLLVLPPYLHHNYWRDDHCTTTNG
ncbi:unnamed protein product, partial [Amoebophrya sp. A120]